MSNGLKVKQVLGVRVKVQMQVWPENAPMLPARGLPLWCPWAASRTMCRWESVPTRHKLAGSPTESPMVLVSLPQSRVTGVLTLHTEQCRVRAQRGSDERHLQDWVQHVHRFFFGPETQHRRGMFSPLAKSATGEAK